MRPLRPPEASAYLREKGLRRSIQTLAKQRVTGGGPRFRKAGRDVVYEQADLDDYAAQILSTAVNSTAELPVEFRKTSGGVA